MAARVTDKAVQRKKALYLEAFSGLGNLSAASRVSGISRQDHYLWVKKDPQYVADFLEAQEKAIDALETEARRRAVDGTERPVYQGGELVGTIREYSDTLLIFLLKGARPERYRERYDIQITPTDAIKRVAAEAGMEPEQLMAEAEAILAGKR